MTFKGKDKLLSIPELSNTKKKFSVLISINMQHHCGKYMYLNTESKIKSVLQSNVHHTNSGATLLGNEPKFMDRTIQHTTNPVIKF